MKIRFNVALNGTKVNPFHPLGVSQNPFPQLAKYEYVAGILAVQKLGGDPIPHDHAAEYIQEVLKGFSKEFVEGCIARFKPGEIVKFTVEFDDGNSKS